MTVHRPNPAYWDAVRKDQTAGLALFDQIPPGIPKTIPDPRTKQESFLSLERKTLTEQQQKVLECIKQHGPICDHDIVLILSRSERREDRLPLNVVNPRRGELLTFGYITLHDTVLSEVTHRRRARWRVV